jgi:protein-L-isoaspartate(D-aspartate) O-methyltransferase
LQGGREEPWVCDVCDLVTQEVGATIILTKMAWLCSGRSNKELIDNLARAGIVSNKRVINAMLSVDRIKYCMTGAAPSIAYQDSPQRIGYGATISAPHMHAMCLELLEHLLVDGAKALDVGSGSGYLVAVMADLVGPNGKVYGIEHIDQLVDFSLKNLEADRPDLLEKKIIEVSVGDGRLGIPQHAPFDVIHVGAASSGLPMELIRQLKVGGRMIVPVEDRHGDQALIQIDKTGEGDSDYSEKVITGVRYVPLCDKKDQVRL